MNPEDDTTLTDDAQGLADFAGGFEGKTAEKPAPVAKEKPAETPRTEVAPPEYVQITKSDWAEMRAAAAKTASYDQQLSKAFGTIGNLQKVVNEIRSDAPRDLKVAMPDSAFTRMAKDFPELAELSREEFRTALDGLKERGKPDPEFVKNLVSEMEIEDLEDAYPDWRKIVGAIDAAKDQPDPDNAFRKWLATKDTTYQDRINGTNRAPVVQRAIRLFQTETRAKPTVKPREDVRADRMKEAVQPRGDGGGAPPGKAPDDDFLAGFNSR